MNPTLERCAPPVKAGGPIAPRPYSAVPHDLIRDRRLIATDVVLAGALLAYARAGSACWPSVRTLQDDIGRSRRAVQMGLRRLKDAGWISERPAENPTGRVLVLAWREGAQRPTPPGRNAAPPRGAQPAALELKNQSEKTFASHGGGERKPPEPPLTRADLEARYAQSGWMDRPPGDPLRRLAERRLASFVTGHQEAHQDVVNVSMTGRPTRGDRPRQGASRGPRPLFG